MTQQCHPRAGGDLYSSVIPAKAGIQTMDSRPRFCGDRPPREWQKSFCHFEF